MTAAALAAGSLAARPAPLRHGYVFELQKLLVQWRVRVLVLACWFAPAVVVAVLSRQSTLPTDTVFGRWMGTSGWAGCLVVLSFAGSLLLPLLASLVAGDAFAVEDRLGTWRHLLVTVRSTRSVFAAKALASGTVVVALVTGLAVSSAAGGLLAVGNRPLVGLTGQTLPPRQAAVAVLLAWLVALLATAAFCAVGLLGSVALGRSTTGLLLPVLLALLLQLAQLLPLPAVVRVSLPSFGFLAWRGLLAEPVQTRGVVVAVLVSTAWTVAATALALVVFVRRDFTDTASDGTGGRPLALSGACLSLLVVAAAGSTSASTRASGSGIDRPRLERTVAVAFGHLYRWQARGLDRPDVTERQLGAGATCDKGGTRTDDVGPGNDWHCVVTWHLPGAVATGSALYQLDVAPDGRFVADGDGPQSVNGSFPVLGPRGPVPNPLWQFDGSVDLLNPS